MANYKIDESVKWQDITPGGDIYESGNAKFFTTGDWRTMKPVFNAEKCKQCLLCAPLCPDVSIPVEASKRMDFDFDHCKGCGVCAKVCPFGAIDMISEEGGQL